MARPADWSVAGPRHEIFDYDSLPLVGRLSLWLSNQLIVSHLQPGIWLDLLCGYRALLQRSQHGNNHIVGFYCLDHRLDPGLAEYGFQLAECNIDKTLPYDPESFDNITVVNGLEHLWHPQSILSECQRVLKVGGALQIVVPTWFGKPFLEFLAFGIRNKQAYAEMNDHKMYYDERTLWPMLVRAGFEPSALRIRRTKAFCSLYVRARRTRTSAPPLLPAIT